MTRTSLEEFNCSLARTVDVIGDKWTLMIIRDAFYGFSSFTDFRRRLGVAKTVLSDRLQTLVDHGILIRVPARPNVERHRYKLSRKGRDLFPIVIAIVQWGDKWQFGPGQEPVRVVDKQTRSPIQDVVVQARNGHVLNASEVTFAPGPGASTETVRAFEQWSLRERVLTSGPTKPLSGEKGD